MATLMAGLAPLLDGDHILDLAFAVAGGAGLIAGAFYRVAAVIALSFAAVVAVIVIGATQNWHLGRIAIDAFGLLVVVQLGYFLGVIFASTRARLWAAATGRASWSALFKRDMAG